uniref:Uncharacterized protein n=1 Tax=Timema tahoe TaxID=61484 RepID=A0A7R9IAG2_9NEOP|nr:unnamed protein product [Timema tahoe]
MSELKSSPGVSRGKFATRQVEAERARFLTLMYRHELAQPSLPRFDVPTRVGSAKFSLALMYRHELAHPKSSMLDPPRPTLSVTPCLSPIGAVGSSGVWETLGRVLSEASRSVTLFIFHRELVDSHWTAGPLLTNSFKLWTVIISCEVVPFHRANTPVYHPLPSSGCLPRKMVDGWGNQEM